MEALLTPGGRLQKPGIPNLYPSTPLIDATSRGGRPHQTIYVTSAAKITRSTNTTDSVLMTPMTRVLHAG